MGDEIADPVPVTRLAAAIIISTIFPFFLFPVAAAGGWLLGSDFETATTAIGVFGLLAVLGVICVGIPIAAIFLRDPAASAIRWMVCGAGSGFAAVTMVELLASAPTFPMLFLTFLGPTLLLINGVAIVFGAFVGLIARTLILWLGPA